VASPEPVRAALVTLGALDFFSDFKIVLRSGHAGTAFPSLWNNARTLSFVTEYLFSTSSSARAAGSELFNR